MPNLAKSGNNVVQFVLTIGVGLGLTLYILATFQTAIGTGVAGNTVGNIITGTGNAVTNVVIPILSVVFVLLLYSLAKQYGLIGGGRSE
jgi:uncharacterized membrane protein